MNDLDEATHHSAGKKLFLDGESPHAQPARACAGLRETSSLIGSLRPVASGRVAIWVRAEKRASGEPFGTPLALAFSAPR